MLELINANPRFGAFFFLDISRKLDAVAQDVETAHIGATMNARVGDLFLHKACVIDANDSIAHAGRKMQETDCNALFVRDGERVGVVTGMNLSKACVLKRMSVDDAGRLDQPIRRYFGDERGLCLARAAADD